MRRLKLIQGLSYAVRGFSCTSGVPFDAEDDIAGRLLSTGRFEELQCVSAGNDEPGDKTGDGTDDGTSVWMDLSGKELSGKELSADGISRLKKAELEALAAEKGIDISDCANNDARAAKICGALGLASMVQMGLED